MEELFNTIVDMICSIGQIAIELLIIYIIYKLIVGIVGYCRNHNKPVEPSYKSNPAYKAEEDDLWIM